MYWNRQHGLDQTERRLIGAREAQTELLVAVAHGELLHAHREGELPGGRYRARRRGAGDLENVLVADNLYETEQN